jgi:pimeloyl-ACP methyl ester carboxylesterase
VLIHGFTDTWRTWELVLPALERRHEVLAPTLAGHAGGPEIDGAVTPTALVDALERALDEAGLETADVVGNSLGGYVALSLAARGRARTVVAFAPAGGWEPGDPGAADAIERHRTTQELVRGAAPYAERIVSSPEGRRRASEYLTVRFEHLPPELLAHQIKGAASCPAALPFLEHLAVEGYRLDPDRITCPVRIVWGTEDRILPWPVAARRYREKSLAHADWVVLDGVGHSPQLDVPAETAELIVSFTAPA